MESRIMLFHMNIYLIYGIPWNCSCERNRRTSRSMEFHGSAGVIDIGALQVPWNSMDLIMSANLAHHKFHGIPWICSCQRNWRTWSSMEFHGIPWNCSSQRNWRTWSSMEFHGIPWNCLCQRNWRTPNSMEFHGIAWNCWCQRNWRTPSSMEFHGTARVSELGAPQVPWNSNCSCHRNWRTP